MRSVVGRNVVMRRMTVLRMWTFRFSVLLLATLVGIFLGAPLHITTLNWINKLLSHSYKRSVCVSLFFVSATNCFLCKICADGPARQCVLCGVRLEAKEKVEHPS